jgi:hypothetical protein
MKNVRHRNSVFISDSRWLAYATAGLAASLVGTKTTEAEIHYSGPLNILFEGHHDHPAQMRFRVGQGSAYLGFVNKIGTYGPYGLAGFFVHPGEFVGREGRFVSVRYVSQLSSGNDIGNNRFIKNGPSPWLDRYDTRAGILLFSLDGTFYWKFNDTGFIGFKFNSGAGPQYGWARVHIEDLQRESSAFTLIDYAYADPGERIVAGQTSDAKPAVPSEGSLGLLSLGAIGLLAWRRPRSVAAAE